MAAERGDLRRHQRVALDSPVQVLWRDRSGTDRSANGRIVDVSELGMRIKLPAAIEKGVYINFNAHKIPIQGAASVRSCRAQGTTYLIGLEFTGGLRWKTRPAGPQA